MAQVSNDNTLNGYRYFLDATGTRQYAIRYENGTPQKDIQVFDETGAKSSFRPGETVFAFEDGAQMTATGGGALGIQPLAAEIKINEDGRPFFFNSIRVTYEAKLTLGSADAAYTLTDASSRLLAEKQFGDGFPRELVAQKTAGNEFDMQTTTSGLILPSSTPASFGLSMPFPPQHKDGAEAARKAIAGGLDANASPFEKTDAQTLVTRMKMGAGEMLSTVFNFESARVTEIFTSPGKAPGLTGHSFAEHDWAALEQARQKLVDLGGKPNAVKKAKVPAVA